MCGSASPLSEDMRIASLARMHDANQAMASVIWDTAVAFHASGTPVQLVAPAIGMSVRSFYRRMQSFAGE